MQNTMIAIALCTVGAEKVVSNELKKLALPVLDTGFGRVRFKADLRGLYTALMGLRAADRVLLETTVFPAEDFDAIFEGVRAVPWEAFIPPGMGLRVAKVRIRSSRVQGVTSVQGLVHKAAAARLCTAYHVNRLPEHGPEAELRVYSDKDRVSVLLDLSGEPLFKRGYRSEGGIAPLRETTAAVILLLAQWRRKFPLWDPFCGSGTIVIEAAMYAWDMAPGLGRRFALSHLLLGDERTEQALREAFLEKVDFSRTIRIYGSDADLRAVSLAASNMERAYDLARGKEPERGVRQPARLPWIPEFRVLPMKAAHAPGTEAGFIVTNPPYGKRLGGLEGAEANYRTMEELPRCFPGWKLTLITDHPGFESLFGRKADSCREITNGAIRSYCYQYECLA
ncbi:MAG: class I SAM-dependent RNA methyltransferase [Treponema sp.]|jgi:putative N6-adenine-specific DNA methylase|nr:class I SAM-dependent RNA methyltransferase [Treponema sp.]